MNPRDLIFSYFLEASPRGNFIFRELPSHIADSQTILNSALETTMSITDISRHIAEKEINLASRMHDAKNNVNFAYRKARAQELYSQIAPGTEDTRAAKSNAAEQAADEAELAASLLENPDLIKGDKKKQAIYDKVKNLLDNSHDAKIGKMERNMAELVIATRAIGSIKMAIDHGLTVATIIQEKARAKRIKEEKYMDAAEILRDAYLQAEEGKEKMQSIDREFASLKESIFSRALAAITSSISKLLQRSKKTEERARRL